MTPSYTDFERLVGDYLDAYYEADPYRANWLGLHQYAGRVADLGREAIRARLAQLQDFEARLQKIDADRLDEDAAREYALIRHAIGMERWRWQTLRHWQTNPIRYGDLLDVSEYIKRDYAPLAERARSLIAHLREYPRIIETAQKNLEFSLPRPFLETALEMGEGMIRFLEETLPTALTDLQDEGLRAEFESELQQAVVTTRDFYLWLREERLPHAREDGYAIGAEAYRQMLYWGEMVALPLDEVLAAAEGELARLEKMAHAAAEQIASGKSPAEVRKMLHADHPGKENLVSSTAAMLESLRQYTLDREIVSIPSEVRCAVAETPPYLRWAVAMLDAPGPLEQRATESYYYVTPPEEDWPPEKQEEWLSQFDNYTLQVISIHEAYPGHYVQVLHEARVPSTVSKILSAYSFVEGWAHYIEELFLDEGYGDGDPRLRLAQVTEALLRACRHIVSVRMHTQGMTVQEATRFFMQHAYLEELPAYKEAVRGTFDPGYLNYCLGKMMVRKLQADYRREQGSRFSLREFHDRLLSFGTPPLPLVRRAMLESPGDRLL